MSEGRLDELASPLTDELLQRLRPVRLLCLDVDGVLSDGHLYYLGESEQAVQWGMRFAVRDGVGIKLLMQAGIELAILSEGALPGGQARARSLRISRAYFGVTDKRQRFKELCTELGLAAAEAAFIGDEVSDVPLLRDVGFAATVPDAVPEVKAAAHYVTRKPGGAGAVREVADLIRCHSTAAAKPAGSAASSK